MVCVYYSDTLVLNDDGVFQDAYAQMSGERRRKTDCFKFRKDKNLCLGAGLLLDYGLRAYGLREAEMHYGLLSHGKPYFTEEPTIHFNISHSGTKVMVAFADCEIGCDIEIIADADLKIAERFFCGSEYAAIMEKRTPQAQNEIFYRLWTLKESFLKATGLGMSLPLSAFEIALCDEKLRVKHTVNEKTYYCREFDIIPGYKSALCVGTPCADAKFINVPFCRESIQNFLANGRKI